MKINGKHTIDLAKDELYGLLQDEEVLARISPGVSKIERTDVDTYKAISEISIGPVRGSFEGTLSLKDKVPASSMTLHLEQISKIGNAAASIKMDLEEVGTGRTEITYDGEAKVSGKLATMGQRILGGVISTVSKQVFQELEKVVAEKYPKVEGAQDDIREEETASSAPTSSIKKSWISIIIEKIMSIWR